MTMKNPYSKWATILSQFLATQILNQYSIHNKENKQEVCLASQLTLTLIKTMLMRIKKKMKMFKKKLA